MWEQEDLWESAGDEGLRGSGSVTGLAREAGEGKNQKQGTHRGCFMYQICSTDFWVRPT